MEYWFNIGMYRFYIGKKCGTNEPISHSPRTQYPTIPLFQHSKCDMIANTIGYPHYQTIGII
jgi:hypothetical protein